MQSKDDKSKAELCIKLSITCFHFQVSVFHFFARQRSGPNMSSFLAAASDYPGVQIHPFIHVYYVACCLYVCV